MRPPTWPEAQMPTAEQWLDWLLSNDRAAQVEIAERALRAHDTARLCFLQNHEGAVDVVGRMGQQIADAYQEGWNAALATFTATYEAARAEGDA